MGFRQMTVSEALAWLETNKNWPEYQKVCLEYWRVNVPDIYPAVMAKFKGFRK